MTENVKILIYISGLIGVSLTAFFMMAFRGPSSLRLESWEIYIYRCFDILIGLFRARGLGFDIQQRNQESLSHGSVYS